MARRRGYSTASELERFFGFAGPSPGGAFSVVSIADSFSGEGGDMVLRLTPSRSAEGFFTALEVLLTDRNEDGGFFTELTAIQAVLAYFCVPAPSRKNKARERRDGIDRRLDSNRRECLGVGSRRVCILISRYVAFLNSFLFRSPGTAPIWERRTLLRGWRVMVIRI